MREGEGAERLELEARAAPALGGEYDKICKYVRKFLSEERTRQRQREPE